MLRTFVYVALPIAPPAFAVVDDLAVHLGVERLPVRRVLTSRSDWPITIALNNIAGGQVVPFHEAMASGAAGLHPDAAGLRAAGPVLHARPDGRRAQGLTGMSEPRCRRPRPTTERRRRPSARRHPAGAREQALPRRRPGGPRRRPDGRAGRVHGAGRTVGLRQVDAAADDRRAGGGLRRPRLHRRQGRHRPSCPSSATWRWCSRATPSTRACRCGGTWASGCGCGARQGRARAAGRTRSPSILGLEHLLDRRPAALSGGQRQRVAMGRAIVREPQAFLMDEPLSNLDAKLRVTHARRSSRCCTSGSASRRSTSPTTRSRR